MRCCLICKFSGAYVGLFTASQTPGITSSGICTSSGLARAMTGHGFQTTIGGFLLLLQLSDCGVTPLHLLALMDNQHPPRLELLILHDLPTAVTAVHSASAHVPASQDTGGISRSTRGHSLILDRDGSSAQAGDDTSGQPTGHWPTGPASWFQSLQPAWRLWCNHPGLAYVGMGPASNPTLAGGTTDEGNHERGGGLEVGYRFCEGDSEAQVAPPVWWIEQSAARCRLALSLVSQCFSSSLNYLMLVVPEVVELTVSEVVGSLAGLRRLKALTLQAPGCDWGQDSVMQALSHGPRGLRVLHVRWRGGQQLGVHGRDLLVRGGAGGGEGWLREHPYL